MKKPITIPNIDIEAYEALKERCRQEGVSVSTYFNSVLAGQEQIEQSEKTKELTERIVQLKNALSKAERELTQTKEEYKTLQASFDNANDACETQKQAVDDFNKEITQLKAEVTAKDAELERVKHELIAAADKTPQKSLSDKGVFVELTPLELALIKHVADKEQQRHKDESITPSTLLKAMFVNYTIHGDMYFFPHPSRSTLRALKAEVEEAEAKRRQATATTAEKENNTPKENHETSKEENHE